MKNWVRKNKLVILGVIAGSLAGYFYWRQVGCSSGTCMITSKWQNSTLYGALMGGLFLSMFKKENNGTREDEGKL